MTSDKYNYTYHFPSIDMPVPSLDSCHQEKTPKNLQACVHQRREHRFKPLLSAKKTEHHILTIAFTNPNEESNEWNLE